MHFENEDSAARVIKVMRRKVGMAPDAAGFHTLGSAELYLGLARDAEKHLRRAVELRPEFGEAWAALAAACLENENPEGARRAAARAEELSQALPPDVKAGLG
ncbi:MAG: hypothetical protein AB1916_05865 [Thermodesulfobacteriota bacterium]